MAATTEDLKDLYENAPFAYVLMRRDGTIVSANATLAEWTGQKPEQLVGQRLRDLLTSGTRIFYETNVAPVLSMQGVLEGAALDLNTANGEAIPVSAVASSRRTADGAGELIRIALFKTTERRKRSAQPSASWKPSAKPRFCASSLSPFSVMTCAIRSHRSPVACGCFERNSRKIAESWFSNCFRQASCA